MEYNYLKEITIGDTVFKITYDYTHDEGAEFGYPDDGKPGFIKFGMKDHKIKPLQFFQMLIHEFKEIIQVEQSTRFYNRGVDGYEFHYNHAQHSDLCCRLAGMVSGFIK